jgi:hypothetical protein
MCARNDNGYGVTVEGRHWAPDDHEIVFSSDLENLAKVYFCGSHGDPLTHPHLLSVLNYCKNRDIQIEIFTNGSLRSVSWWRDLVDTLSENDRIIFGIDGIETNHLYRQNTDIDKILERLSICCKSQVKTQWDFIPFKHNEHELNQCREIAKSMSVDEFRLRKTARFKHDNHSVRNPVTGIVTHRLEPPTDISLRHPDFDQLKILSTMPLPTDYNINCIYKNNNRMYVNSRLQVLPCSYIGSDLESGKTIRPDQLQIPVDELNLKQNTWMEILAGNFYKNNLVESFTDTNTIGRCIHTCGVVNRILNQNQVIKIDQ